MKPPIIYIFLIFGCLYANPQLVNGHRYILLKEGQLFSINENNKKYNLKSIDFELELINNHIDIKHIHKITLYTGNSVLQFGKASSLCGLVLGLTASVGNTPPLEVIGNIGIFVIPMSIIGSGVGFFFPKEETYVISENEWNLIP